MVKRNRELDVLVAIELANYQNNKECLLLAPQWCYNWNKLKKIKVPNRLVELVLVYKIKTKVEYKSVFLQQAQDKSIFSF